jgi:lipopolysaccharide/colanic/teichoic acid biosynthesis glycosyltransferase
MSNEVIYKYFRKNIKIAIIGNQYELTPNDFILLDTMHIDYVLFKDLNSFILSSTHKCILVDNTNYKIGNHENIHNFDLISLDKFLEIYLRKIQFDKSPKSQFVIRYNLSEFILKKFIDFLVIIFFIPICLIIIPISFLIIKFQSTGNLIFMQNRVGKRGKVFKIIKIRSMHDLKSTDDFDEGSDEQVRIFPYGLFMRKTRIDEMPQFINVLKGQMHIAGPRAEWLDLHNHYNSKINNYYLRNNVAPGITGFAQVMFRYGRSEEDAMEKLMFDIYYIKNWSLWLEIEIGIRTISVMLRKKGI